MKLRPWRALSPISKIQVALEAALMTKGYSVLAVNLNVSPSVDAKLRLKSELHYVRDDFRRAVTEVLHGYPICFFLIKESTNEGRNHFHGALLVPNALFDDSLITKLEDSIQARPSVRRYRKRYSNKIVVLKAVYEPRGQDPDGPAIVKRVDSDWLRYCTKNYSQEGAYVMSPELTALAGILFEHLQNPASIGMPA